MAGPDGASLASREPQWSGLRVVITGAAGGVGLACARALAARDVHLILSDLDAAALAAVARETGGLGRLCDVASEASVAIFAADLIDRLQAIDVLINAAGSSYVRTLGMMRMTRSLLPLLMTVDGRRTDVINIAAGEDGEAPAQFAYAASAGAFQRLSDALADLVEGTGVEVTGLVQPAPVPEPETIARQVVSLLDSRLPRSPQSIAAAG